MTPSQIVTACICVLAIAVGQLLFKRAGIALEAAGTWMSFKVWLIVGGAMAIYGVATLLWISLLRHVDLSKAYLFMALSFLIVPLASYLVFDEAITTGYFVGAALVIAGLLVAIRLG